MALAPVKFSNFGPGLNNRCDPSRLGFTAADRSQSTYLYGADNVDITSAGFLRRRRGTTGALLPGAAHSLWGDGAADGYAVMDGNLVELTTSAGALVARVLEGGFTHAPVTMARMPTGAVVWSDGRRIGAVLEGVAGELVPDAPNPVPAVQPVAGSLPAGHYLFSFTRITDRGESAATQPTRIEAPGATGFVFTGMTPDVAAYMSGPNGDILTRTDGDTVVALNDSGARAETLLLERIPAGQIVRHYSGRLLVARGPMLAWSETYRYGLWNPGRNFIQFEAPITVVEPCRDGVFVCADRTYWLPGDLAGTQLREVLPYGGVAGSGASALEDEEPRVFWVSPHGLVVGRPTGTVAAVQENALVFAAASRATALYRRRDGLNHLVYARQGVEPLAQAARDFTNVELHRKETVL